jgi:hypothetical protein
MLTMAAVLTHATLERPEFFVHQLFDLRFGHPRVLIE